MNKVEVSEEERYAIAAEIARQNAIAAAQRKAAEEADNERIKQIFEAFVEVETDHLKLSSVVNPPLERGKIWSISNNN